MWGRAGRGAPPAPFPLLAVEGPLSLLVCTRCECWERAPGRAPVLMCAAPRGQRARPLSSCYVSLPPSGWGRPACGSPRLLVTTGPPRGHSEGSTGQTPTGGPLLPHHRHWQGPGTYLPRGTSPWVIWWPWAGEGRVRGARCPPGFLSLCGPLATPHFCRLSQCLHGVRRGGGGPH